MKEPQRPPDRRYLIARTQGSLQEGVRMENGGTIQVTVNKDVTDTADKLFFLDRIDNLIIGTALYFKEKYPDKQVTLISKDTNVRIKADAVGINSENYEPDTIKFEELYTGWNPVEVEKSVFDEATVKGFLPNTFGEFCPNQYLRITDNQDQPAAVHSRI